MCLHDLLAGFHEDQLYLPSTYQFLLEGPRVEPRY